MRNGYLLVPIGQLRNLIQIRCPRQVQHNVPGYLAVCIIQFPEAVWLHGFQLEDISVAVSRTAPWGTAEDDSLLAYSLELLDQCLEGITLGPPDLVFDSIDFGVMLCAFERCFILFDGKDLVPTA